MTPQERVLLLQKLASPKGVPTAEARQAIDMLKSLYDNPVQVYPEEGLIRVDNPVTGIVASGLATMDDKTDIQFKSKDSYYDRPKTPRSKVQLAGIEATMGQLLDVIPSTKEQVGKPGVVSSQLAFEAIHDDKDRYRSQLRGKPTNQRANAYNRYTRGAMRAYPPSKNHFGLDWPGYTEKIGPTTWQPKNSQGRYMKHVQWDPRSSLDNLKRLAQASRLIPGGGFGAQILDGVMTADSIIEGVTGVSPTEEIMLGTVKTLADMYRTEPTTNIGPILPF